jgi:uncharacterized protein (TIGR03086 family)
VDQLVAHQRAQEAFAEVLAKVTPDQLDAQSPCTEWNAKAVIDHVIGGNQWVQQLAGLEPKPVPDDDLDAAHTQAAAGAQAVFAAPDGLSRTYELPFGTLPGSVFINIRAGDVFTHAWDLARATGQPTDLDPELAVASLTAVRAIIAPSFRGEGRPFAEEQPCPDGRSAADSLAAFLGRAID